jgi:hypothetical protein
MKNHVESRYIVRSNANHPAASQEPGAFDPYLIVSRSNIYRVGSFVSRPERPLESPSRDSDFGSGHYIPHGIQNYADQFSGVDNRARFSNLRARGET